VRLVMDVAMGPSVERIMPIVKGAEAILPMGGVKLLDYVTLLPGKFIMWMGGPERPFAGLIKFSIFGPSRLWGQEKTAFFVGVSPGSHRMPIKLDFVGSDGEVLGQNYSIGSNAQISVLTVKASFEEIKGIQVAAMHPNLCRLVLDLPEISGLPEANRGVKDLLEVEVPHVYFEDFGDFNAFLSSMLQASVPRELELGVDDDSLPKAFAQITVRELLNVYTANLPRSNRLAFNPVENEITVVPRLMGLIKAELRSIFR
jgi:hypothetical protein